MERGSSANAIETVAPGDLILKDTGPEVIELSSNSESDSSDDESMLQGQPKAVPASEKSAAMSDATEMSSHRIGGRSYTRTAEQKAKHAKQELERYHAMSPHQRVAYLAKRTARKRKQQDAMSPPQEGETIVKKQRTFSERYPPESAQRALRDARGRDKGRDRRRAMSPGARAEYNARGHKNTVLRKLRSSQAYQDAEPAERQRMEESHVQVEMEEYRARRAAKAKNRQEQQENQAKGPELQSHGEGPISTEAIYELGRARDAAAHQRRDRLKRLRDSQTYQDAGPEWRQRMEGFVEDMVADQRKLREIQALALVSADEAPAVVPKPKTPGEKVVTSLLSGFEERMLERIRQGARDSKEQEERERQQRRERRRKKN